MKTNFFFLNFRNNKSINVIKLKVHFSIVQYELEIKNIEKIIHIACSLLSPCTQLYNIIYDCKLHKLFFKALRTGTQSF